MAAVFTNPIDVVKIRLQLQGEGKEVAGRGRGLIGMFVHIFREEGVLAFWKGIIPSLLREITYSSIRLGAYEPLRNLLSSQEEQGRGQIAIWKKLVAGAAAGAVGSGYVQLKIYSTNYDLLLVKARQSSRFGKSSATSSGGEAPRDMQQSYVCDAPPNFQGAGCGWCVYFGLSFVLRNAYPFYILGLYRGVVPTIQRAALLTATQLGTYDEIKHTLLRAKVFEEGPLLHFCSGSVAGLGVALVTSPVDTVRTR